MKLDAFRNQFRSEAEPTELRPAPGHEPSPLVPRSVPSVFNYETTPDSDWSDICQRLLREAETVDGWKKARIWKDPIRNTLNASDKVFITEDVAGAFCQQPK